MDEFVSKSLQILKRDQFFSILRLLKPIDVLKFCQTEKYTQTVCNDRDLFKFLMHEHYPNYKLNKNDPKEQYIDLTYRIVSNYHAQIKLDDDDFLLSPIFEVSDIDDIIDDMIFVQLDGRVKNNLEGYVGIELVETASRKYGSSEFFTDFDSAINFAFDLYMYHAGITIKYSQNSTNETLEFMNLDPDTWTNKNMFGRNVLAGFPAASFTNYENVGNEENEIFSYYVFKVILPINKGMRLG